MSRATWKQFWRRYRTEVVLFSLGVLFFGGGLVNLIAGNRASSRFSGEFVPSTSTPASRPMVGPQKDQALDLYVDAKKKLLEERASKDPGGSSAAVLSFNSYRTANEAASVLKGRNLSLHALQVRIPLPGLEPATIALGNRTIQEAIDLWKKDQSRELVEEASELERLIPTVTDPDFREVYEADAQLRRKAAGALEADASIVFAIVLRASHSELLKTSKVDGVRLVDLPEDRSASFDNHSFMGLLPDSGAAPSKSALEGQ